MLACSLLGCGGADAQDHTGNFVGSWGIDSVVTAGEEVGAKELDLYKAMGVYLVAGEDKTLRYELFGVSVSGTYEPENDRAAVVTFSDSEAADAGITAKQRLEVSDEGKLVLEDGDDSMRFVRIDPEDVHATEGGEYLGSVNESDLESTLGALREDLQSAAAGTSPLEDAEQIDQTLVGDATCSVRVVAKGTYLGDAAFLLSIENRTDARIVVSDNNSFTVDGYIIDPVLLSVVDAGSTSTGVLWFPGVTELDEAQGELVVTDYQTNDVLSTYDFEL